MLDDRLRLCSVAGSSRGGAIATDGWTATAAAVFIVIDRDIVVDGLITHVFFGVIIIDVLTGNVVVIAPVDIGAWIGVDSNCAHWRIHIAIFILLCWSFVMLKFHTTLGVSGAQFVECGDVFWRLRYSVVFKISS